MPRPSSEPVSARALRSRQVHEPHPSWERLLAWLVVGAVCLEVLADVLPRLLVPLVVLGGLVAVLRLVFFHTRRW